MLCVLATLRDNLLPPNQICSFLRSELTASFISAIDFDEYEMLVSSAYMVTFVLCNGMEQAEKKLC